MTTWLVRLKFLSGQRSTGAGIVADAVSALRKLPGVEQLDFHVDLNDDSALWAVWRLRGYDDMLSIYDEAAFKTFAAALTPNLVPRGVDNFILSELPESHP